MPHGTTKPWVVRRIGSLAPLAAVALCACHAAVLDPAGPVGAGENTNNVLALAFGVMIVALIIGGSVWIMYNMNHNMMPMGPVISTD